MRPIPTPPCTTGRGCTGRGAHLHCSYGASGAFRDIAEALGCAVAVMPDAKGLFPEDHPQYIGIYCRPVRDGRRDSRHGPAGGGRTVV